MKAIFRALLDAIERGGTLTMASLLVAGIALWILVLERLGARGISPRAWILPERRKGRSEARRSFLQAFSAYCTAPSDPEKRAAVLASAEAWPSPVSLFARRVLFIEGGRETAAPGAFAHSALRLGKMEVECGMQSIQWLIHAALLLGIAGVASALTQGLLELSSTGLALESAWQEGADQLLVAAQALAIVFLPASVAGLLVMNHTRSTARELSIWHRRLAGRHDEGMEGIDDRAAT